MTIRVYNSRIPNMVQLLARSAGVYCVLSLWAFSPALSATDWSGAEQQLVGKIASATGPGAFDVRVENRSSLSSTEAEGIRRGLLADLAAFGIRIASADEAAGTVTITLSEGLQSYVWVTEIRQGTNQPQVVLVSLPRPAVVSAGQEVYPVTIHKTSLWTSEARILDVAVLTANPQQMIVLESGRIVLYQFQDGRWQQQKELPIVHAKPWPRDLRGRLILKTDHLFDAFLPGVICRSSAVPPLTLDCKASDDPWPLGGEPLAVDAFFAASRNFFTGAISGKPGITKAMAVPAFYSAAAVPREKYTLWIFDAVDAQVHLLDGLSDHTTNSQWGSDIASLHSNCGTAWQVLATGRTDGPTDSVTAFEISDREFIAVSQPLEFSGRITALWPDADSTSIIAISQLAESGKYEADRITAACSQ